MVRHKIVSLCCWPKVQHLQQEQVVLPKALLSACQHMCCRTGVRTSLAQPGCPLCRRYDKFSVDITEQVSVDLEGQHELTVEVFDPTGASKA